TRRAHRRFFTWAFLHCLRTLVLSRVVPLLPQLSFSPCRSSVKLCVLCGEDVDFGLHYGSLDSASNAVSVSSSTSHLRRILKIVLEPKPARINWRKTRAACFLSCGLLSRLRRKYSRACFSSSTSAKESSTAFSRTSLTTPFALRSVMIRRRPNFSLSRRNAE